MACSWFVPFILSVFQLKMHARIWFLSVFVSSFPTFFDVLNCSFPFPFSQLLASLRFCLSKFFFYNLEGLLSAYFYSSKDYHPSPCSLMGCGRFYCKFCTTYPLFPRSHSVSLAPCSNTLLLQPLPPVESALWKAFISLLSSLPSALWCLWNVLPLLSSHPSSSPRVH